MPSMLGKKDCPICGGVGFVHLDLPLDHPDFGRLQVCSCRQKEAQAVESSRLYRLSNLDAFNSMTFETFNAKGRFGLADEQTESLKYALNQATHYAHSLPGWLVFLGGYGCGKTHLAAAVANFAVSMGVATLFLTVPDLLDWLRYTYDNPAASFESRFEEIRNVRLLVLDDLGTQNATPWAQEKLYQIINHRYVHRFPLVISTNIDLEDLDGRIRSRLEDPDLVTKVRINAPDFRSPVRDSTHPQLSSLHMHTNRTFGTFSLREQDKMTPEERKNLEKVWHSAQKYAEKPRGWIVFSGTYGTGKTHLAAAIGNYRAALGDAPMFVVVPDLLDHLRAAFSPSSSVSYDHMFEEVLTCRLLILDDFGTQSATPWAREKLYQIFNYRYNAELPTVITTSLPLEEIDPRIRSRMLDNRLCTILGIQFPSYRTSGAAALKSRRLRKTD
jgi:DNA replication protein DnaC